MLTTMPDCTELLHYYQQEADKIVGPYGLNGPPMLMHPGMMRRAASGTTTSGAAATESLAAPAQAAAVPDSSTNVQVAGVDESDIIKTSGDLMVSVVDGKVRITRLAGARTTTLSTWQPATGYAQAVLLDGASGNLAVILDDGGSAFSPLAAAGATRDTGGLAQGAGAAGAGPAGAAAAGAAESDPFAGPFAADDGVTRLTVLDLSDPAHPRPVRRLTIDGSLAGDVRLEDGELRLAVRADTNGLAWKQPHYRPGTMPLVQSAAAEKRSTAANRQLIDKSTIANWLPQATVTELNAAGKPVGAEVRRPLLDCAKVAVPSTFSGVQTIALVSADLRTGSTLSTWRAAGVVASGSTLYATADHAWLATSRWDRATPVEGGQASGAVRFAPVTQSTQLHLFDTPLRGDPRYVASGQVEGSLLDQYAMDEQNGVLRVASTTQGKAPGAAPTNPAGKDLSQGRVTVLKQDGDRLAQIGLITGLGLGEQIRAVRFDGAIGYVVTYRQTDPLYTIDLSDPARPRLRSELKLTGYSAYLHPSGPGRVLGLGRDGTENDQVGSLQLSLFDVGDLDSPRRLAQQQMPGAWTDAEADHHAFTMAGNLVLVPFTSNTLKGGEGGKSGQSGQSGEGGKGDSQEEIDDAGVMAVRVTADSIGKPVILRPIANGPVTLDLPPSGEQSPRATTSLGKVMQAAPLRVAVHDGLIYTLTATGIAVHNSTDFSRITFAAF